MSDINNSNLDNKSSLDRYEIIEREDFDALRLDHEMVKQRMRQEIFRKFQDKYVQKSFNHRVQAFWNYLIGSEAR